LNSLDEETQHEVEARLASDEETRAQLEKLREALEPLGVDRDDIDPPSGLVIRTIGRIAEIQCESRPLPLAPAPTPTSFAAGRSRWRRIDLAVAASLFIVAAGLTALGVFHLREAGASASCQNNLREFYVALDKYHSDNKHFPNVRDHQDKNRDVAGMVVPMLISANYLPANTSVRCPGNGEAKACPVTLEQARSMSDDDFERAKGGLSCCYAYALGNFDGDTYLPPQRLGGKPASTIPLMGDCPPSDTQSGENSPNHGGRGQNVLFQDGHVVFLKKRLLGDHDLYLNKDKKVAAGRDADDFVLGASASKPVPDR